MEHFPRKPAEPFSKPKRCKQWLVSKGNFIMEHEKKCLICMEKISIKEEVCNVTCFKNNMLHPLHKNCMEVYIIEEAFKNCPACRYKWR